ncbi:MAG: hypothetical protein LBR82_02005 [Desulfovibrio sp.]|jgi:hypothetical protein|nr:hypothetical protein [Desulfovibrio sp.]
MSTATNTTSTGTATAPTFWWTAQNLIGYRSAKSLRAAVKDAHDYVMSELNGEGTVTIYDRPPQVAEEWMGRGPVRVDERSLYTRLRWQTRVGQLF